MREEASHLVKDFLRYLRVQRKRSLLTARNYGLYLKRFTGWLSQASGTVLEKLTGRDVERFRAWLTRQPQRGSNRALAPATQNYHLIALRSFLKFLKEKGTASLEPTAVALAPSAQRHITALSQTELTHLLEAPDHTHEPDVIRQRDAAVLRLLTGSGLTVAELVALERRAIENGAASVVVKRKGRERSVPLAPEFLTRLSAYLAARSDRSAALFVRHDRAQAGSTPKPLTARSVQRLVEHYRRAAGLTQKVTPHTLRHTFALGLVAKGGSLKAVQQALGLKHPGTAQVYRQGAELITKAQSAILTRPP